MLEVDGQACMHASHDAIVALIRRNQGTLTLAVRYSDDYHKAILLKKILTYKVQTPMYWCNCR